MTKNNLLPESLHFVGVGGIGMSALAQMAASLDCAVSGSDRALNSPENARIINALRKKGVKLYPQDGSRYETAPPPAALVYSTAIEEDNPDFVKAPHGTIRLHRSVAMKLLVEKCSVPIFAVTGSCGKTTVSAWLAESLDRLGASPSMISGGLANHFIRDGFAGNYAQGQRKLCVLEADESDKSLLNYTADHAIVLNIGTDHYSREELAEVFRSFLRATRKTAVLEDKVLETVGLDCVKHLKIALFSTNPAVPETLHGCKVFRVTDYRASSDGVSARIDGTRFHLPVPGMHNAANAAAVTAALSLLGYGMEEIRPAAERFSGVWRRFDFAGRNCRGTAVYDDYAHNVEKICSCIESAHEVCSGRVLFIFQPHGYGPFGFMRKDLYPALEKVLAPDDYFAFLPVYYAGGTTSFEPKAEAVAAEYADRHPGRYLFFQDRLSVREFIKTNLGAADLAVVMGARDNSLSDWARELGGTVPPVQIQGGSVS